MNHSKYWPRIIKLLDEQFPKGESKERGSALVLVAMIEILLRKDEKPSVDKSL